MTRKRELAELAAGVAALLLIAGCVRQFAAPAIIRAFLAAPSRRNPAGGAVWPNLAASAVCVAAVWWRIRVRMIAHHAEALAQAARHHRERLARADLHHQQQAALIASGHDAVREGTERALAGQSAAVAELADATRAVLAARSPRRPAAPKAGGS